MSASFIQVQNSKQMYLMAPWWLDATTRNPQCFRKDKGLAELFKVHITFIQKYEGKKKKSLCCVGLLRSVI